MRFLLLFVACAIVAYATILADSFSSVKYKFAKFVANCPHKEGNPMAKEKQNEPKPTGWELADPKPPIIRSGHMENRRNY
jgi:hypothetical protein